MVREHLALILYLDLYIFVFYIFLLFLATPTYGVTVSMCGSVCPRMHLTFM